MDLTEEMAKVFEAEAATLAAMPAQQRADAIEDMMFTVVRQTGIYDTRLTSELRFSKAEPTVVIIQPTAELMDDQSQAGMALRKALGEVSDILLACMFMLEEEEGRALFQSIRTANLEMSVASDGEVQWGYEVSVSSILTSGFLGRYTSQKMEYFHPEVLRRVSLIFSAALATLPSNVDRSSVFAAQETRFPKPGDPIRAQIRHVVAGGSVH
ncbi:hypothetical protein ACOI1H_21380 [Loktanella sp. DJP18]|uniref:hypothetical protein n=1 Tax=Loktanella sp. DJP18 TaxID=3409788 RepID=UPI003BB7FD0F